MSQVILNTLLSQLATILKPIIEITTISGNVFQGQLLNVVDSKYLLMKDLDLKKGESILIPTHIAETLVNTEKIKSIKCNVKSSFSDSIIDSLNENNINQNSPRKRVRSNRRQRFKVSNALESNSNGKMQSSEHKSKNLMNFKRTYKDMHLMKSKFQQENWKDEKEEFMLDKVLEATKIFDSDNNKQGEKCGFVRYEPDNFYDCLSGKGNYVAAKFHPEQIA